jgi:hypothetical protein
MTYPPNAPAEPVTAIVRPRVNAIASSPSRAVNAFMSSVDAEGKSRFRGALTTEAAGTISAC